MKFENNFYDDSFSENEVGESKAVWNSSENSSAFVWPLVPKMILIVNVSIMIDIFDNIILEKHL